MIKTRFIIELTTTDGDSSELYQKVVDMPYRLAVGDAVSCWYGENDGDFHNSKVDEGQYYSLGRMEQVVYLEPLEWVEERFKEMERDLSSNDWLII